MHYALRMAVIQSLHLQNAQIRSKMKALERQFKQVSHQDMNESVAYGKFTTIGKPDAYLF